VVHLPHTWILHLLPGVDVRSSGVCLSPSYTSEGYSSESRPLAIMLSHGLWQSLQEKQSSGELKNWRRVSLVERETKSPPPPGFIPSITSRMVGSARPMTPPAKKRLHLIGSTRAMTLSFMTRTWLALRALLWWRRCLEWIGGPSPWWRTYHVTKKSTKR
jgi:hypothetical protein